MDTITGMPLVLPLKRGPYTVEEVQQHNTASSLWVIMNRKVYDVTAFHKRHPGGPAVLLQMAGKDATAAAAASHKTSLPSNLMWEFCIGHIVRSKPALEQPLAKAAAAKAPARPANAPPAAPRGATPAVKQIQVIVKATEAEVQMQPSSEDAHGNNCSDNESGNGSFTTKKDFIQGEAALEAAVSQLKNIVEGAPELEPWTSARRHLKLEEELQLLLRGTFSTELKGGGGGGDWPANLDEGQLFAGGTTADFIKALHKEAKNSPTQEEEVIAQAVAKLRKDYWDDGNRDPNLSALARFYRAIRLVASDATESGRDSLRTRTISNEAQVKDDTIAEPAVGDGETFCAVGSPLTSWWRNSWFGVA